jgi:hypothetical protein
MVFLYVGYSERYRMLYSLGSKMNNNNNNIIIIIILYNLLKKAIIVKVLI